MRGVERDARTVVTPRIGWLFIALSACSRGVVESRLAAINQEPRLRMISNLKRTPGIYLVGFMAAGKTTIGRLLAERLGWSFVDLDDDIEAQHGAPSAKSSKRHGEPEFRRIEAEALRARVRAIERGHADGGGAGRRRVRAAGQFRTGGEQRRHRMARLPARDREAAGGGSLARPLARDPERFEELYHARHAAYARADFRIAIESDDPAVAVEAMLKLPALL